MNLTKEIAKIRKIAKKSQREIGKAWGVTGSYIEQLEKGFRQPSQKLIMRIIEFCKKENISLEVVYEDKLLVKNLKIL